MNYCLICKEIVGTTYEVEIKNKLVDASFSGYLCRFCHNKFLDSLHNKGFFKVAKMVNWLKGKDSKRVL